MTCLTYAKLIALSCASHTSDDDDDDGDDDDDDDYDDDIMMILHSGEMTAVICYIIMCSD